MGTPKLHDKTNHSHSATLACTQCRVTITPVCDSLAVYHCSPDSHCSVSDEGAMTSVGFNVVGKINSTEVS